MSNPTCEAYEVGYGRPPQSTRFKKGHSGNPSGRPKNTKNLKTDLAEELAERITVSEGGKPKRLSKQRALVKSLTANAIKGDSGAIRALLSVMMKMLDTADVEDEDIALTKDEKAVLANFERRILRQAEDRLREKSQIKAKTKANSGKSKSRGD